MGGQGGGLEDKLWCHDELCLEKKRTIIRHGRDCIEKEVIRIPVATCRQF